MPHPLFNDRDPTASENPLLLPITNGDAAVLDLSDSPAHRKKVFMAKKSLQAGPNASRTVSAGLALLALAAHGVPEGWSLAQVTGSEPSEAVRLLPPVMLR